VQFVVQANSYRELDKAVETLLKDARANSGLENVDTDLKLETPQLRLSVDRERAADLGVEVETVGRSLETALAGRQVTRFTREGKQYDVIVQLEAAGRDQPEDIASLYVRGRDGQLVQLANLTSVSEDVAAKSLNHFNRKRAAIISANLKPGYSLGEALTFMDRSAAKLKLATDYDGQSREFRSASGEIALTFILALLFIYLVLAAQFESFISPFIILLTVPLAAAGGLATLLWTGQTFNVYSQIGLVMLVGLITKHGILIVEFANQLADAGKGALEAVTEAAVLRLRPILMTTAAMLLGALPLALAIGAGAESRQPIGWVIVGGLAFGTLLTLFVIPSAWLLFRHGFRQLSKS
jgi:multidrug efflux pump